MLRQVVVVSSLLWVAAAIGCSSPSIFQKFNRAPIHPDSEAKAPTRSLPATSTGWTEDYSAATEESRRSQKVKMLLFTGSDWCKYCKNLDEEVLSKPAFESWSAQNVIPVKLDFPRRMPQAQDIKEQNELLKQHFESYISGYPTVVFVDPKGQVLGTLGYERGGAENWIAKAETLLKMH